MQSLRKSLPSSKASDSLIFFSLLAPRILGEALDAYEFPQLLRLSQSCPRLGLTSSLSLYPGPSGLAVRLCRKDLMGSRQPGAARPPGQRLKVTEATKQESGGEEVGIQLL